MDNIVEQDHHFMKRKINSRLGFGSHPTACRAIQKYEMLQRIRNKQIEGTEKSDIQRKYPFIASLFGVNVKVEFDSAA